MGPIVLAVDWYLTFLVTGGNVSVTQEVRSLVMTNRESEVLWALLFEWRTTASEYDIDVACVRRELATSLQKTLEYLGRGLLDD